MRCDCATSETAGTCVSSMGRRGAACRSVGSTIVHAVRRPSGRAPSRRRPPTAQARLESRARTALACGVLRPGPRPAGTPAARRSPSCRRRRLLASAARGSRNRLSTARGRTSRAAAGKDDVVQGVGRAARDIRRDRTRCSDELRVLEGDHRRSAQTRRRFASSMAARTSAQNTEGSRAT